MSAAQDGRARAIEAAVSSICGRFGGGTPLLDSNLPVGDLARTAIDAALADGGVVTNGAYAHACRRVSDLQHRCDRLWRERRDLRDRVERAEAALRQIAAIGDVPQVNATCHWHAEAVERARAALAERERS